ncbi:hypothetical protein, partial [Metabacillus mangrovi]|uniref:hypothetical protein n=1 Tax=Metabacillus mangrovi TaxID=1491830 RepID=UPI0019D5B36D
VILAVTPLYLSVKRSNLSVPIYLSIHCTYLAVRPIYFRFSSVIWPLPLPVEPVNLSDRRSSALILHNRSSPSIR